MRKKFFVATLFLICAAGVVGCKSTSQLAWWKSAKKSDVESTVLAHSAAPELPSEVAKQAERLAVATTTGSKAAPFVPNIAPAPAIASVATAPAAYPTTNEAPAAAYPTTEAPASHVGTLAMPYDPSAVPASTPAVAAQPTSPKVQPSRYATTNMPSSIPSSAPTNRVAPNAQTPTPGSYPSTASRYELATQTATSIPAVAPAAAIGNRYAATTPVSPAVEVPTIPATSIPPINTPTTSVDTPSEKPTTAIAQATPYRPGGTSSYPNSLTAQTPTQIATRPDAPSFSSDAAQSSKENASETGTLSVPTVPSPRYR